MHTGKLGCSNEEILSFLAHFVAAGTNSGTNASVDGRWLTTKLLLHGVDGCEHDAASRATPATVRNAQDALVGIVQRDRGAIGERQRQSNAALPGDQRIS